MTVCVYKCTHSSGCTIDRCWWLRHGPHLAAKVLKCLILTFSSRGVGVLYAICKLWCAIFKPKITAIQLRALKPLLTSLTACKYDETDNRCKYCLHVHLFFYRQIVCSYLCCYGLNISGILKMRKLYTLFIVLTLLGYQAVAQAAGGYKSDSQAFGAMMACAMEGFADFDSLYNKDPDFIAALTVLGKNLNAGLNGSKSNSIPQRLRAVLDSVPNSSRKNYLTNMVLVCNDFDASSFKNPALKKYLSISLSQRRLIANEIQSGKYTTQEAFEELMRVETLLTQELMGSVPQDELMRLMQGAMNSPELQKMMQRSNTKSLERRINSDYGIKP